MALARYIVSVYIPSVPSIKCMPDVVHAPVHICKTLRRQNAHLHGELLEVVLKSMRRNSFMVHGENVLLAMLGDDSADVRAEGVTIIRQLRQRPEAERTQMRAFRAPTINTAAQRYTELVHLSDLLSSGTNLELPLVVPMLDADLEAIKKQPLVTGIPSHTQSTERPLN